MDCTYCEWDILGSQRFVWRRLLGTPLRKSQNLPIVLFYSRGWALNTPIHHLFVRTHHLSLNIVDSLPQTNLIIAKPSSILSFYLSYFRERKLLPIRSSLLELSVVPLTYPVLLMPSHKACTWVHSQFLLRIKSNIDSQPVQTPDAQNQKSCQICSCLIVRWDL